MVQHSHPYMTTGKTIALIIRTLGGKGISLFNNMLSRLVTAFLPRSKCLLISWLLSLSTVISEHKKIKSVTVFIVSPFCSGPDAMIFIFWMTHSFPNTETVHCSMSGSNRCFSYCCCIQISQEAGKVVWYSHLFKNFPQFVEIHTVKGFSVVSEAKIDVFLEFSCFFYDPTDAGNLISHSSAFSKSNLYMWNFLVHVLLKPSLKDSEHYLAGASMWMSAIVWQFELSLALPFFETGMKTDLFQSCGHCWVFQICWHIEWNIFTVSSFRIWNTSAGIPSPSLALFVVMLP